MKTDEKATYRLYARPLTAANIEAAAGERFYRATASPLPGYVLVYTERTVPKEATEITADKADLLSPADTRWLMDCAAALAADELKKHEPEILKGLSEKMETLEQELKARKKQMNQESGE